MKVATIPCYALNNAFKQAGFTDHEFMSVMETMIMVWRVNDFNQDLTRELVFNDLDMHELSAQHLWLAIYGEVMIVSNQIRELCLQSRLISWKVGPYNILLELEDEAFFTHGNHTAFD
ncbi:hypothetical protein D3C81_375840 [compost metagenome]